MFKRLLYLSTLIILAFITGYSNADGRLEISYSSSNSDWYYVKDSVEFLDGLYKGSAAANFVVSPFVPIKHNGREVRSYRVSLRLNCKDLAATVQLATALSGTMGTGETIGNNYDEQTEYLNQEQWKSRKFDKLCKRSWEIWK
jgi:hypothetical protein